MKPASEFRQNGGKVTRTMKDVQMDELKRNYGKCFALEDVFNAADDVIFIDESSHHFPVVRNFDHHPIVGAKIWSEWGNGKRFRITPTVIHSKEEHFEIDFVKRWRARVLQSQLRRLDKALELGVLPATASIRMEEMHPDLNKRMQEFGYGIIDDRTIDVRHVVFTTLE